MMLRYLTSRAAARGGAFARPAPRSGQRRAASFRADAFKIPSGEGSSAASANVAASLALVALWCVSTAEGSRAEALRRLLGPHGLAADAESAHDEAEAEEVVNWSSTHKVTTKALLRPESIEEAERLVAAAHEAGSKLRIVGSALSPNGIALSEEPMISLGLCDKVLEVDPLSRRVRVEAGATVRQVVAALEPYALTLENFASINEQQIGGFIQVGAHGTGATVPPVDEQVVALKLATPALGTLSLSRESNPALFNMARVGLGALGLVTEVTLQCVPRHRLVEQTFVLTPQQVREQHKSLLRDNRHVKYMWIPYADAVVVVACNPLGAGGALVKRLTQAAPPNHLVTCDEGASGKRGASASGDSGKRAYSEEERLQPLLELLRSRKGDDGAPAAADAGGDLSFADLRDRLLAAAPLDKAWVIKVNRAEAEFWRRSEGTRIDFSDRILAFECGGQQWVHELAFPCGTVAEPSMADIDYIEEVLQLIEANGIAAPSPIEQRWTATSSAPMSPASAADPDAIHSWVGIIMYLPTDDAKERGDITKAFFAYRDLCKRELWDKYGCKEHWAKIEMPESGGEEAAVRQRLQKLYDVDGFNSLRHLLDPKNVLSNANINAFFGGGGGSGSGGSGSGGSGGGTGAVRQ